MQAIYIMQMSILVIVVIVIFLCFQAVRRAIGDTFFHEHWRNSSTIKMAIAAIAGFIGLVGQASSGFPKWLSCITTVAMHIGVLATYMFFNDIFKDSSDDNRDTLWLLTIIFSSVTVFINILRTDNLGFFIDIRHYHVDLVYYSYQFFYHITILIIVYYIVVMLMKSPYRQHNNLVYRTRWLMIFAGMISLFIGTLSAVISVSLSLLFEAFYYFVYTFYAFNLVGFILLSLGILPKSILSIGLRPVLLVVTHKQEQEDAYLSYLHQNLTSVIGIVQLPDGHTSPLRVLVEIAHARRILWTNVPYKHGYTACHEACIIFDHVSSGKQLCYTGQHPPPPRLRRPKPYYVTVAKHLKQLEAHRSEESM